MHVGMRGTIAALALLLVGGLAGCSNGGGGLLQTDGNSLTASPAGETVTQPRAKVAIAPVVGAPSQVATQIVDQVTTTMKQKNIAVAGTSGEQVDYTLRGYVVAAREATGTKVSYIWDVTNATGARVHRITGEEIVTGAGAGDPWASVSPQLIQVIAAKTGGQLDSWMPKKAPAAERAASPPAVAGDSTNGTAGRLAAAPATRVGAQPVPGTSAAATGSIGAPGTVTALVPQVVGAPGDGSQALAAALRNELMRNGVKPTPPGQPAYRVEGRVKM